MELYFVLHDKWGLIYIKFNQLLNTLLKVNRLRCFFLRYKSSLSLLYALFCEFVLIYK